MECVLRRAQAASSTLTRRRRTLERPARPAESCLSASPPGSKGWPGTPARRASRGRSATGSGRSVRMAWAAQRRLTRRRLSGGPPDVGRGCRIPQGLERPSSTPSSGRRSANSRAPKSVQARQAAIKTAERRARRRCKQTNPWNGLRRAPGRRSTTFSTRPNIDVSADVASLYPVLSAQGRRPDRADRTGAVTWSQVTAGPVRPASAWSTSDQGIVVHQQPIPDQRHADHRLPAAGGLQDRQGRRAAKLYYFSADLGRRRAR